jgi:hypothetical protein
MSAFGLKTLRPCARYFGAAMVGINGGDDRIPAGGLLETAPLHRDHPSTDAAIL